MYTYRASFVSLTPPSTNSHLQDNAKSKVEMHCTVSKAVEYLIIKLYVQYFQLCNLCKLLLPYHSHKVAKSGTPRISLMFITVTSWEKLIFDRSTACNTTVDQLTYYLSCRQYIRHNHITAHAYQVPIHRMVSKCFLIMALQLVLVCPISYACLVNFRQHYTVVNSFNQLFGFNILRQQIYYQVEHNHAANNTAKSLSFILIFHQGFSDLSCKSCPWKQNKCFCSKLF